MVFFVNAYKQNPKFKYQCEACDYAATQASHLTLHQRDVHEGLQYPCDNCGKEFTQKTHVRTHKNIVHMLGERAV